MGQRYSHAEARRRPHGVPPSSSTSSNASESDEEKQSMSRKTLPSSLVNSGSKTASFPERRKTQSTPYQRWLPWEQHERQKRHVSKNNDTSFWHSDARHSRQRPSTSQLQTDQKSVEGNFWGEQQRNDGHTEHLGRPEQVVERWLPQCLAGEEDDRLETSQQHIRQIEELDIQERRKILFHVDLEADSDGDDGTNTMHSDRVDQNHNSPSTSASVSSDYITSNHKGMIQEDFKPRNQLKLPIDDEASLYDRQQLEAAERVLETELSNHGRILEEDLCELARKKADDEKNRWDNQIQRDRTAALSTRFDQSGQRLWEDEQEQEDLTLRREVEEVLESPRRKYYEELEAKYRAEVASLVAKYSRTDASFGSPPDAAYQVAKAKLDRYYERQKQKVQHVLDKEALAIIEHERAIRKLSMGSLLDPNEWEQLIREQQELLNCYQVRTQEQRSESANVSRTEKKSQPSSSLSRDTRGSGAALRPEPSLTDDLFAKESQPSHYQQPKRVSHTPWGDESSSSFANHEGPYGTSEPESNSGGEEDEHDTDEREGESSESEGESSGSEKSISVLGDFMHPAEHNFVRTAPAAFVRGSSGSHQPSMRGRGRMVGWSAMMSNPSSFATTTSSKQPHKQTSKNSDTDHRPWKLNRENVGQPFPELRPSLIGSSPREEETTQEMQSHPGSRKIRRQRTGVVSRGALGTSASPPTSTGIPITTSGASSVAAFTRQRQTEAEVEEPRTALEELDRKTLEFGERLTEECKLAEERRKVPVTVRSMHQLPTKATAHALWRTDSIKTCEPALNENWAVDEEKTAELDEEGALEHRKEKKRSENGQTAPKQEFSGGEPKDGGFCAEGPLEGTPREDSNPLTAVAPEILAELAHLDLSLSIVFKDTRIVGGGTYGDVSIGNCAVSGQRKVKIAIKRLRFWWKKDIKTLFEREIYVWSKLNHPNILPLLGFAIDDSSGYPLLISEWMENGSAWEYVTRNPSCNVLNLVVGIASGLAHLHSLGIVHSDIKSDNVMVSDLGNALICDFGCSRMVDSSRTYARLTSSVKGTSRYLAYELVVAPDLGGELSGSHTTKTDVWAFGMTAFELFTHERPYANLLDTQVVCAIMGRTIPQFPSTFASSIESSALGGIKRLCNDCWKHDSTDRPSMQSVLDELRRICHIDPMQVPA
ncbi:hypothetical protein ACEPAF_1632 [Sanghuangporus sanghuang]